MQRDDFMKLKLKFAQTDVAGKIAIYTESAGACILYRLSARGQYCGS